MTARPAGPALLLGTVVAVVAAVLGVALFVIEPPAEERRRRLDERRVQDLHELAAAIDRYWTREEAIPPSLQALADWRRLDEPPTDPATGEPYRYRVTGERSYALCAIFDTESADPETRWPRRRHRTLWHHPPGDHCFELEAEEVER